MSSLLHALGVFPTQTPSQFAILSRARIHPHPHMCTCTYKQVLAEQVSAFEAQITEHAKAANQVTASANTSSSSSSSSSAGGGTSPSAPPPPPPSQGSSTRKQRPRSPSPSTAPPPLAPGSATAASGGAGGIRFRNTAGKEIAAYDPTAVVAAASAGAGESTRGGGDLSAEFEVRITDEGE